MRLVGLICPLLAVGGCQGSFTEPCHVVGRQILIDTPTTFGMATQAEIVPQGAETVAVISAATLNTIDVRLFDGRGTVQNTWSYALPSGQDLPPVTRIVWIESGLGVFRRGTEDLPSDESGPHFRTFVLYEYIPNEGEPIAASEIAPLSCVDCGWNLAIAGYRGRSVLIFAKSLSLGQDEPSSTTPASFLLLAADGIVESQGDVAWLTPGGAWSLNVANRAEGLLFSDGNQRWLLAGDMQVLGGPITTPGAASRTAEGLGIFASPFFVDWSLTEGDVGGSWIDSGNVFVGIFDSEGTARRSATRVSAASSITGICRHAGLTAVTLNTSDAHYLAAWEPSNGKLGGDVLLLDNSDSFYSPAGYTVGVGLGESGFGIFLTIATGVEHFEVSCDQR
jgi:hypothetical protein